VTGSKVARVLLVDDDENFTFALSALLKAAGHEPVAVHDGARARSAVEGSTFDVAVLDLRLPDVDGLELIEQLLAIDPRLPVLLLSGHDNADAVVTAMRRGALDYLVKPVDRATFLGAVTAGWQLSRARRAGATSDPLTLGASEPWRRTLELVAAAALAPKTTVLITGEPGVGKEVVTGLLHRLSKRRDAPLVSANAACFSPSLIESELFGHEAGAFTGATKRRRGLFEQAEGGVLFLDEIGELPLDLQGKLLRVLEGHPFRRVGGEDAVSCDVRLVCATNRQLPELVKKGQFRADLLERLRVFEIAIPPLRERQDDIPHLAHHFLAKFGAELGYTRSAFEPEALAAMTRHSWPGNVRELRNVIERALVLAAGANITLKHLPPELRAPASSSPSGVTGTVAPLAPSAATLAEVVRQHVIAVYEASGSNLTHAATKLGISRLALRKKLREYGLKPATIEPDRS